MNNSPEDSTYRRDNEREQSAVLLWQDIGNYSSWNTRISLFLEYTDQPTGTGRQICVAFNSAFSTSAIDC